MTFSDWWHDWIHEERDGGSLYDTQRRRTLEAYREVAEKAWNAARRKEPTYTYVLLECVGPGDVIEVLADGDRSVTISSYLLNQNGISWSLEHYCSHIPYSDWEAISELLGVALDELKEKSLLPM